MLVTKSNFFENIFLNDFTFLSQEIRFSYLDTKNFRPVAFLGMKILSFCYRIQNFRTFHQVDERHGLISEQAVHTFSYKSEQNVDQARLMPQQGNRLKLLPQIELVKLYRLGYLTTLVRS